MTINVVELMSDPDFASTFLVRRPRGDRDDAGVFQVLDYTDITMVGVVQPADPAAVAMLPEGERLGNVIEVWSAAEIRTGDAAESLADMIVVDGETFRVIKSEDWSANGYSHVFAEGFLPPAVPS